MHTDNSRENISSWIIVYDFEPTYKLFYLMEIEYFFIRLSVSNKICISTSKRNTCYVRPNSFRSVEKLAAVGFPLLPSTIATHCKPLPCRAQGHFFNVASSTIA